jgi:hypothetical protein
MQYAAWKKLFCDYIERRREVGSTCLGHIVSPLEVEG